MKWVKASTVTAVIAIGWVIYQVYIFLYPQVPLIQRPIHVVFALALTFLAIPLTKGDFGKKLRWMDWVFAAFAGCIGLYFVLDSDRLLNRMAYIDPVLTRDSILCLIFTGFLLEGTRRTAGISLFYVLAFFIVYAFLGSWFPGWLQFKGMNFEQFTDIMFLSDNGIFGIPAGVSVDFIFYFILFGALFAASGGGQFFTDMGLKVTGRTKGGAAKASVVSSALFGMVSGSAVANVSVDGIFTIPLMKKSGYSGADAAGIEAATSTGGQLMPPVMGAGAFIMAQILGVPYFDVAKAAALPAIAFFLSLFLIIDFNARRTGIGNLTKEESLMKISVLPRLHLLLPVLLLIYFIAGDYSVSWAVIWAIVAVVFVSLFRKDTRLTPARFISGCVDGAQQAASVAVPIAAIGIIIGVTIQSGLAMKFSTMLMDITGGSTLLIYLMIISGLIVLGMGLPTVAAYLMGAIFFVPPLVNLGISLLAAHLFVFYYSILSMVTPPVALAAYAAAGLANASVSRTGWSAFRLSWVCFLIPLVFIYDEGILLKGSLTGILIASSTTVMGTVAWAAVLSGYFMGALKWPEKILFLLASLGLIAPTVAATWVPALILFILLIGWRVYRYRLSTGHGHHVYNEPIP